MLSYSIALVAVATLFGDVEAYFRINCGRLMESRTDPIVSPGKVSSHLHTLVGGSSMDKPDSISDVADNVQILVSTPLIKTCSTLNARHARSKPTNLRTGPLSCSTSLPMAHSPPYLTKEAWYTTLGVAHCTMALKSSLHFHQAS